MSVEPQLMNKITGKLTEINGGRGFLGNLLGLFCGACMLGLANIVAHSYLKVDLNWFLDVLLIGEALYFLLPWLILKFVLRRPISER